MTYIKDGKRIIMTKTEESDWKAHVKARPPQSASVKSKLEKLSDLMVSKGIFTKKEIDQL